MRVITNKRGQHTLRYIGVRVPADLIDNQRGITEQVVEALALLRSQQGAGAKKMQKQEGSPAPGKSVPPPRLSRIQ